MKKSLTIVKFGGGVLGVDGESIPQLIRRLGDVRAGSDAGPVVVVSAPKTRYEGKEMSLTDVGLKVGEAYANSNPVSVEPLVEPYLKISEKYMKSPFMEKSKEEIQSSLRRVKQALNQTMENRRFVDVNRARVLAHSGEMLMCGLMDGVLRSHGIDSWHPGPEEWPIVTDRDFENASFSLEASRGRIDRIVDQLEDGKVVCVGGYIGITEDGLETTYERGGSDRTAVDLALLLEENYRVTLDFEKEEIVLSADPKIVKEELEPVLLLSYNEADLAGRFGMKIVDPVAARDLLERKAMLPILITDMSNPLRATRIIPNSADDPAQDSGQLVKIVTGRKDCAILEMDKFRRDSLEDYLRRVKRYEDFLELRPYVRGKKDVARFLFLNGAYTRRYESELKAFDKDAEVIYGLGAITLVGDDMGRSLGIAARVFEAAFHSGINVEDGDVQGPTSSVLVIVKEEFLDQAVRAIHAKRREMNMEVTAPTKGIVP